MSKAKKKQGEAGATETKMKYVFRREDAMFPLVQGDRIFGWTPEVHLTMLFDTVDDVVTFVAHAMDDEYARYNFGGYVYDVRLAEIAVSVHLEKVV